MRKSNMATADMKTTSVYRGFQVRDGHGIVFVSNLGEIYPSGFLPLHCGNVRTDSLVDIYRNSDVFRALHAPDQFHGKCGACEYSHICGGSRARAFACFRFSIRYCHSRPHGFGVFSVTIVHQRPRARAFARIIIIA